MSAQDPIDRLNAALSGRYRVGAELGSGGMATVYRAQDERHDRTVALKVLRPELAAAVGSERFLGEIRTTANLHHPHILPLFDSGEADGLLYYVMPFLEGETLQDRIGRERQLSIDDAVRIASDVAEALDHAHARGVIHRDIKPANVLLQDGRAVVADFGIALAVSAAGTSRLTETGLSVGTPHYMSPEQATGDRIIGPATDIYALGCVLYEMVVGEPPFTASTPQGILGKILTGERPSAMTQRGTVPINVDAAIAKALEKVPADRFRMGAELVAALEDPGFRHGSSGAGAVGGSSVWKAAAAAFAALFLTVSALYVTAPREPDAALSVERWVAPFGAGVEPLSESGLLFDLSDDGSLVVFEHEGWLWVRRFTELQPSRIPGTEGATSPTVAPDGREVAFVQDGAVRASPVEGGSARLILTDAASPHWDSDGYIYAGRAGGVSRVPGVGGEAEEVTRPREGESGHLVFDVLPNGAAALLTVSVLGRLESFVVDLATGVRQPLAVGYFPQYASGHVAFLTQGGRELLVAPFDVDALEMTAPPTLLLAGVSAYSLSDDGKLLYHQVSTRTELVWAARSGQVSPFDSGWSFDAGLVNEAVSLSPDGRQVAFRERQDDRHYVSVKSVDDGTVRRLTFSGSALLAPQWWPDGRSVIYSGSEGVYRVGASGGRQPEVFYRSEFPVSKAILSPGRDSLVLRTPPLGGTPRRILVVPADGDGEAAALLPERGNQAQPTLSPDGSKLAYVSDETGSDEVYVRTFPDPAGGKVQVSTGGGIMPVWARSGRELFFLNPREELVAVPVAEGQELRIGPPAVLFRAPTGVRAQNTSQVYDVAPGDDRFLVARAVQDPSMPPFVLVQNWFEDLRTSGGS